MLTVHHLDNSRSQRVLWLLEELGVPYEIAFYKRDPETMLAPRELRAVHPLGKAPVVTIDDGGERVVLAESGAILEELVDRYGEGRLRPAPGTQAARDYRYWMHYAEGSAMSPLLLKLIFGELPKRAPWLVKPLVGAIAKKAQSAFIDPQLKTHMGWWEASLEGRDFLAGEFTAADIQMSFPVEAGLARAAKAGTYPRVEAYLARLHARPAWKKALERGGPYAILGG